MLVLSVIMTEAKRMGYRPKGSNSCRGIRRYRREGRKWFLSDAEIGRLSSRFSAHEGGRPLQVDAVLAASGHRVPQERGAHPSPWSDYREGRLFLRDGKTGAENRVADGRHAALPEPQARRHQHPVRQTAGPRSFGALNRPEKPKRLPSSDPPLTPSHSSVPKAESSASP